MTIIARTTQNVAWTQHKGEHHISECHKLKQDKAKYKLKTADIIQRCKDNIILKAKKDNVYQ